MDTTNLGLLNLLGQQDGAKEAEGLVMSFIKDRLREGSFADQVIPPSKVTRAELQVSENTDTLIKLIEIEPTARAMKISFNGQPDTQFINGQRVGCGFFTLSTLRQEITEQSLQSYSSPITKQVEQIALKEMVELKDREFLVHNNAAVEGMQEAGNGSAIAFTATAVRDGTVLGVSKLKGDLCLGSETDDFVPYALQKSDMIKIKNLLMRVVRDDNNSIVRVGRLSPAVMLMTKVDLSNVASWTMDQVGSEIAGETTKNGYAGTTLLGLKIITTIKTDILTEGNIYVFTSPEFYGVNYILNEPKFWIHKEANRISWQSWMDIGMCVVNIASVIKLELYSGSVTPGAETTGYQERVPVEEVDMGGVNNKVESGLVFPRARSY